MKQYGTTKAIVLAYLRKIGASCDVPIVVSARQASIGIGIARRTVSAALQGLNKDGAIHYQIPRIGGAASVRLRQCVEGGDVPATGQHEEPMRVVRDGLAQKPTPIQRLDSVRALLDAVG